MTLHAKTFAARERKAERKWMDERIADMSSAMTIPEQAIEAAALGIINAQREHHGLDPIQWDFPALSSWHRESALRQARGALEAAQPLVGVERAALPPLRAREEIVRAIVSADGYDIDEERRHAAKAPHGTSAEILKSAENYADAILSSTAGQEWRDISSAPKNERILIGGFNPDGSWQSAVGHTTDYIHPFWTHWTPLPAPPVAEPKETP